jgi:hypothetical protein
MLPLACTHFWIKLYTSIAFEGALALRSVWAQCLVHFAAAKYPLLHKLSTRVLFLGWLDTSIWVCIGNIWHPSLPTFGCIFVCKHRLRNLVLSIFTLNHLNPWKHGVIRIGSIQSMHFETLLWMNRSNISNTIRLYFFEPLFWINISTNKLVDHPSMGEGINFSSQWKWLENPHGPVASVMDAAGIRRPEFLVGFRISGTTIDSGFSLMGQHFLWIIHCHVTRG